MQANKKQKGVQKMNINYEHENKNIILKNV